MQMLKLKLIFGGDIFFTFIAHTILAINLNWALICIMS